MKHLTPIGYHVVETNDRVPDIKPEIFRWKWRAKRRCRKLNDGRLFNTYRHEVQEFYRRWMVVAMQNVLIPDE